MELLPFVRFIQEHTYYHDAKALQWGFFNGRRVIDGLKTAFKTYAFQKRGTHGALAREAGLGDMGKAMADGWVRFAILRNGESLFDFAFRDEKDCAARLRLINHFLDKSPLVHGEVTIDAMKIDPSEPLDWMWYHQTANGRWVNVRAAQRAIKTAINGDFSSWQKNGDLESKYEDD